MSIHTNYRVACESYELGRALGLSADEAHAQIDVGNCIILSDHGIAERPHRLPPTEEIARDEAEHAGWVQRNWTGDRWPRTYDVCPGCAPVVDELMQAKVAEAVLQS